MFNKKLPVISFVLYVLAGILALFSIWSVVNIHEYISSQQVAFTGNEYSIISYYMSNAGLYLLFAIVIFSLGWILQKSYLSTKKETSELVAQPEIELGTFGEVAIDEDVTGEATEDVNEDVTEDEIDNSVI